MTYNVVQKYFNIGTYGKITQNTRTPLKLFGGLPHVTSRGNIKGAIYLDEEDRLNGFALINEVCSRFSA